MIITSLQREEDNGDLPLACFNIHKNTIYIYNSNKWDKLTQKKFIGICEYYIYWPICSLFYKYLDNDGLKDGTEIKIAMWTNKINKETNKRIRFYNRAIKDIFNHYQQNNMKIFEIDYE